MSTNLYGLSCLSVIGENVEPGLMLDNWMDAQDAAEVMWRGHIVMCSKSWLVEAIEKWMKSIPSDPVRSKDPLLLAYGKIGIITFAVQAIEDYACAGYAYLKSVEKGVERIYEFIRDFDHPKLRAEGKEVGSVYEFFNKILSDDLALQRVLGFPTGSDDFTSTKQHLQSVYDFYNRYRPLHLRFKHGQAFVPVIWKENPAIYLIPDNLERKNGQVRLPKEPNLIPLDEWELAGDIILRMNGYFFQLHALSRELFPKWKQAVAEEIGEYLRSRQATDQSEDHRQED